MPKCPECGSTDWNIEDPNVAMQIWHCKTCGHTETVHVNFARLNSSLPKNLAPVFTLMARWKLKPTANQILEVQGIIPKLRNVSSASLMRKAIDHSTFELGRFNESEMQNLEPRLRELGIEVERVPLPSQQ